MKLALQLIKKNKRSKSPVLNLSRCGLVNEVPPELFDCVWLEKLNLGGGVYDYEDFHWVDNAADGPKNSFKGPELLRLRELRNLQEFCCTESGLEDIGFLAGLTGLRKLQLWRNRIRKLEPLQPLTQLVHLNISDNPVGQLLPLAMLPRLNHLDLQGVGGIDVSVLKPVASLRSLNMSFTGSRSCETVVGLTQLGRLEMRGNDLPHADFLAGLTHLRFLDLEANKITRVDFLKDLTALSTINLLNNQVTHFDLAYLRKPYQLWNLRLEHNPIQNLPLDLTWESRNCAYALRTHFNIPAPHEKERVVPANTGNSTNANTAITGGKAAVTTPVQAPPVTETNWWPFMGMTAGCAFIGGLASGFRPLGFLLGGVFGPTILFIFLAPRKYSRRRRRR